jgi:hypothetical protein
MDSIETQQGHTMNQSMTTGQARQIVNQYGIRINAADFMDCIESMDDNLFQLTVAERSAYLILVHEMDNMSDVCNAW